MNKYTPGPWSISKLATPEHAPEYAIHVNDGHGDLARVIGHNVEANTALIAASPGLLTTLNKIAGLLRNHPDFKRSNSVVHYCAHVALSAITQATGENQ